MTKSADAEAEDHLDAVATAVTGRVATYDEVLFGLRGVYGANLDPFILDRRFGHDEFDSYMRSLELERRYPGVQVAGIAPLIRRSQLEDHIADVEAGVDQLEGDHPPFEVYPETESVRLLPISFIHPLEGNENAFGLDFFSEENRRTAAERARDTGLPSATAPITLVQETESQQAFLMMVPIYKRGITPPTHAGRRAGFSGVTYAAFRMGDLVEGVIDIRPSDVLEIYSMPADEPLESDTGTLSEDNVIFSHHDRLVGSAASEIERTVIDIGGQRWTIVAGRAVPGAAAGRFLPLIVLAGGLGIVALLAATMHASRSAQRANAAKSEFLSRMSHELRTPLNAVIGFSQLLQMDELRSAQRASLDQIEHAGRHLLELVDDVLEISRIEDGSIDLDLGVVCISELSIEVVELLQPAADSRQITLSLSPSDDSVRVVGDERGIRQTLLNLCSNAIKYNHFGGTVAITVEAIGSTNGRISVIDSGVGMSADDQARLFQPFDRLAAARSSVEGVGLGLVLTKNLVEEMGGSLGVLSTLGDGSTFWFDLPLAEPIRDPSPPIVSRRQVLHIEDNPANQVIIEHVVATHDLVDLHVAVNGPTAADLARHHPPDLVLLDIDLVNTTATAVVDGLRSASDRPFTLLLLGADHAELASQRDTLGARGVLHRPLDIAATRELIDRHLERRSLRL